LIVPYYQADGVTIYCGDALAVLPEIDRFDAVITDPPYSSGGQFRSDRMRGTVDKYVNSDTCREPAGVLRRQPRPARLLCVVGALAVVCGLAGRSWRTRADLHRLAPAPDDDGRDPGRRVDLARPGHVVEARHPHAARRLQPVERIHRLGHARRVVARE
jgi:hypothetical protein